MRRTSKTVGTDVDAVALSLAPGVVDDRDEGATRGRAPLTRTIRMGGGPALLGQSLGVGAHAPGAGPVGSAGAAGSVAEAPSASTR